MKTIKILLIALLIMFMTCDWNPKECLDFCLEQGKTFKSQGSYIGHGCASYCTCE